MSLGVVLNVDPIHIDDMSSIYAKHSNECLSRVHSNSCLFNMEGVYCPLSWFMLHRPSSFPLVCPCDDRVPCHCVLHRPCLLFDCGVVLLPTCDAGCVSGVVFTHLCLFVCYFYGCKVGVMRLHSILYILSFRALVDPMQFHIVILKRCPQVVCWRCLGCGCPIVASWGVVSVPSSCCSAVGAGVLRLDVPSLCGWCRVERATLSWAQGGSMTSLAVFQHPMATMTRSFVAILASMTVSRSQQWILAPDALSRT